MQNADFTLDVSFDPSFLHKRMHVKLFTDGGDYTASREKLSPSAATEEEGKAIKKNFFRTPKNSASHQLLPA